MNWKKLLIVIALILVQFVTSFFILTFGMSFITVYSFLTPSSSSMLLYSFLAISGLIFGTIYLTIIRKLLVDIKYRDQIVILTILGLITIIPIYVNYSLTAPSYTIPENYPLGSTSPEPPNFMIEVLSYFIFFMIPSIWRMKR